LNINVLKIENYEFDRKGGKERDENEKIILFCAA
jgi:hypothetical protein